MTRTFEQIPRTAGDGAFGALWSASSAHARAGCPRSVALSLPGLQLAIRPVCVSFGDAQVIGAKKRISRAFGQADIFGGNVPIANRRVSAIVCSRSHENLPVLLPTRRAIRHLTGGSAKPQRGRRSDWRCGLGVAPYCEKFVHGLLLECE